MYVSGMNPWFGFFFATTTLIIAVPTAIKVYNWVLTLWRGNIHLTIPMLFSLGFIVTFVNGGITGLFLGNLNESLPFESNKYEAAICVGVFTHGHVGPSRFKELVRVVKPGGIICFTVNEDVYKSYGFDDAIKSLEAGSVWKVLELSKKDYMIKKSVKGIYCVVEVI